MGTKPAKPEWAMKLELLRQELGFSQAALAKCLHVSAMATSRWERGVNQPNADMYIELGKMAGSPGCWYFWEKAGLHKEDVAAVMEAAPAPRAPKKHVIPSAGLKNSKEMSDLCALPLYTKERDATLPRNQREHAESFVAPRSWCPNPEKTFCMRMSGEQMTPMLRTGNIFAVDESERGMEALVGKIVLAAHPDHGVLVSWLQKYGATMVLVPENHQVQPTYIHEGDWQMLGRVLWWLAQAP